MDKVRIGLIGVGWIGAEHGRNILSNPRATLAGICDAKAEAARRFLAQTGANCPVFDDYRQLLRSGVDAVVIASPNAMHAEMCLDAAQAGKHVYCEKPMGITLQDCRRVLDAVRSARVRYLIGYHRRMNPLYGHVKALLSQGRLGRPFLIESDYIHHIPGQSDRWSWLGKEAVAGSLFHAGSGHNVDLLRFFGGELAEVVCMKGTFLPRANPVETEDTALALFRFTNGALGKVHFSIGAVTPFQFNLRLYGTKGTVLNNRLWFDDIPRFADPGHEKDCVELPAAWVPDNVQGSVSEPWRKLMDHFVEMLLDGAECVNDVESACRTSVACFAAMESARTGKVISIKGMEA